MPLPRPIRFVLRYVGVNFALFLLLRAVFFLVFRGAAAHVESADLEKALWIGMKFDFRLALVLGVVPGLLAFVPLLDPERRPAARRIFLGWIAASGAVVFFLYALDFAHFGWLHERLNSSSAEHLENPLIALETIWQSYHVVLIFGALGVFLWVYAKALDRFAVGVLTRPKEPLSRSVFAGATFATVVIFAGGIYGRVAWFPLRWSEAYFSGDPFVNALGLNPVTYSLWDTIHDWKRPFDEKAMRAHYARMAAFFHVDAPDEKTLTFARHVPAEPGAPGSRPNIVIVLMESFSALKVGRFGHVPDLHPTPRFDELTKNSVFFTHFFMPRPPTARAIFATVFSLADVATPQSASRTPRLVHQTSIASSFEGYEKMYMLGGSASFANIRGVLQANIPGLKMYEEDSWHLPHDDVWGVNDLALLEQADRVFDETQKSGKPFIAVIQLAGNHPPYTVPERYLKKGVFELEHPSQSTLEKNGFASLDAYNGIRFMDRAVGNFFDVASQKPYFENTVFFLYGDHGTATTLDTPYHTDGMLSNNHIPCVIYAPKLAEKDPRLAPRVIDHVVSSVDVMPTAAELAGVAYDTRALGRPMLADRPAGEYADYVSIGAPEGVVTDRFLLQRDPAGHEYLYLYDDPSRPTADVSAEFPDEKKNLDDLLRGMHESTAWMLYHNAPAAPTSLARDR